MLLPFLLHHYGSHCTERYHCTQPHKNLLLCSASLRISDLPVS
ncbi:hypothetical protein AB97_2000 [Escherichia coli 1-110-08_S3_C1]|nr:Hypothetical protein FORC43_2569 [Escherichia coli]EYE13394.1 hypothetical protein AC55_2022 [Escherichia coli 1-110-08_S3_C3]EYE25190.1 hypothetical protein AC25_1653 [Escherichia coli 1-110-08_S3_C2]EYE27133.1 hypothetical protein AB97_2000 [Escherichia coli 1-110-08_S3_C1]KDX11946.1 hypothetical protein AD27_0772 [Escherichia coli 2-177-06_S4_C3]